MRIEQAKQLLVDGGFTILEGEMHIAIGEHEIKEPIIGVRVSQEHKCFDKDCNGGGIHLVGTRTAIEAFREGVLRQMIEELVANR